MNPERVLDQLNTIRSKLKLRPLELVDINDPAPVQDDDVPVTLSNFYHAHPKAFASLGALKYHAAQREHNGMKAMGAIIELPAAPDSQRVSLRAVTPKLLAWCRGERPWL